MSTTKHPLLLATAIAHGVLSLAHTAKGFEQFKHPSMKQLPAVLRGAIKAGWYEGGVWFAIAGILNYKWSRTGLLDSADKTIAGLLTILLLGAGPSYYRSGDKPTGIILSLFGIFQALSARKAVL